MLRKTRISILRLKRHTVRIDKRFRFHATKDKNLNSEIETYTISPAGHTYNYPTKDKNLNSEIETKQATTAKSPDSATKDKNLNSEIETKQATTAKSPDSATKDKNLNSEIETGNRVDALERGSILSITRLSILRLKPFHD